MVFLFQSKIWIVQEIKFSRLHVAVIEWKRFCGCVRLPVHSVLPFVLRSSLGFQRRIVMKFLYPDCYHRLDAERWFVGCGVTNVAPVYAKLIVSWACSVKMGFWQRQSVVLPYLEKSKVCASRCVQCSIVMYYRVSILCLRSPEHRVLISTSHMYMHEVDKGKMTKPHDHLFLTNPLLHDILYWNDITWLIADHVIPWEDKETSTSYQVSVEAFNTNVPLYLSI